MKNLAISPEEIEILNSLIEEVTMSAQIANHVCCHVGILNGKTITEVRETLNNIGENLALITG